MVRTYRQQGPYQLISPWEQAMRNADASEGQTLQTGKRVYRDPEYNGVNLDFSPRQGKGHVLPPINQTESTQMIRLLENDVGKALNRSDRKLETVVKEMTLYDPHETGSMPRSAVLEILSRYKVPADEQSQKRLVAMFLSKHDQSKFDYNSAITFMRRSLETAKQRSEEELMRRRQDDSSDFSDGSLSDRSSTEYEPNKKDMVQQQFADRRDAGLLIQMERSFRTCGIDPHDLIDQLEETIRRSCRNDENLVENMHLKGQVVKHHFPFNTALTLKLIERLDPYDRGYVEWPPFIQFLRRSVNGTKRTSAELPSTQQIPTWENRAKLANIKGQNALQELNDKVEVNDRDSYYEDDLSMFKFHDDVEPVIDHLDRSGYKLRMKRVPEAQQMISPRHEDDAPLQKKPPPELYYFQTAAAGKDPERVDSFVRIADALKQKARHSNNCLNTLEVKKIVNYYNMLFDLNLDADRLDNILLHHADNGDVHISHIIDALGTLV